ncbi:bifunctional adenosylcobinamide kinase/adenosylcobinamide-phosphate guanylyltransferase [Fundidesulfovibrio butyratiphilus]
MIRLILGGEKSGKSNLAYARFASLSGPRRVLAMGLAQDQAFRRQILEHRLARDPRLPVEEPGLALPESLARAAGTATAVLVDSLDFWVFACMEAGQDRARDLCRGLEGFRGPEAPACFLVSCEVGLGPLAATALSRRFVRTLGAVNQHVAALADEVALAVAGLELNLKGGASHGLL